VGLRSYFPKEKKQKQDAHVKALAYENTSAVGLAWSQTARDASVLARRSGETGRNMDEVSHLAQHHGALQTSQPGVVHVLVQHRDGGQSSHSFPDVNKARAFSQSARTMGHHVAPVMGHRSIRSASMF
jgi:hypothetical protein